MAENSITIFPVKHLYGELSLPGDKSISHRAAILAALAEGTTHLVNFAPGQDATSTLRCLRQLGVRITQTAAAELYIEGNGLRGWQEPTQVLDVGNSGTTLRLLLGALAGQELFAVLTGDETICRRPMARVIQPLSAMGAQIRARENNSLAPVCLMGGSLRRIEYRLPVASAQLKSALLLAGLVAQCGIDITEPIATRDHTERLLATFGVNVLCQQQMISLPAISRLTTPGCIQIPGDISSAAFLIVAATFIPNTELRLKNIGLNPTRIGFLQVLWQMGADITIEEQCCLANEVSGDIVVKTAYNLSGIQLEAEQVANCIDELPILAVAATQAAGVTKITGAGELKLKESNRILAIVEGLNRLGANIEALEDGMIITGPTRLIGGTTVASYGDHRIALALAVAGMLADKPIQIEDWASVDISFPNFLQCIAGLFRESGSPEISS